MKKLTHSFAAVKLIIAAIIFLAMPQLVTAQATYKLVQSPNVTIKVLGSSNVHDWTMASTAMESQGDFTFVGDKLQALHVFSFHLAVKSLHSDHASMDDRTYKSVNASKYPNISYKLTSAVVTPIGGNKYLIKTKGDLTIAGATQPISMDVTATVGADNTITCTGAKKIQLTDYGIKPPTFMLGTMKVTNDLTIQFNLIYKK
ncbi:YceI family protein [Mucilaginibacter sp. L196]|uniref:YceI family protein n=1 Tax=Mucilaginibacter sp. L196 TaxID=1641870 RepID=UPI00131CFB79|nr:YceI family protein [Mucilaginibacter sp. L196]